MSKNAKQIVNALLEYGIDPDAPRPGSPDDPWRQQTGPLPPMQFGGRPGPADEPEAPAEPAGLAPEQEAMMAQIKDRFIRERTEGFVHPETGQRVEPVSREEAEARWLKVEPRFRAQMNTPRAKQRSRFMWKPPTTEALIQELGGFYCFTCKEPTTVKEGEGGKNVCAKCGAEINYSKYGKNPVPKAEPKTESSRAWSSQPPQSATDSGMGGGDLPLRREVGTYHPGDFPSKGFVASDPEAMIQRDPLWRSKTAQFADTMSLMRAYLEDPNANPQIKHAIEMMLPKE